MRKIIWTSILAVALPLAATWAVAEDEQAPDAPKAQDEAVDALIEQLGADDFRTREAASKKLAALGNAARPALEKAARDSKSPEVRWRAGQILQQLSGVGAKPLGAVGGKTGSSGPDTPPLPGDPNDVIRRLRDMMKKFEGRGGNPFGGAFADFFGGKQRLEAPGLVLERLRSGQVSLKVARDATDEEKDAQKKDGQAKVEDVYVGSSLAEILARNPELTKHAGMEELKRLDSEKSWPALAELLKRRVPGIQVQPFPQGGFGVATSSGVSITHDADGVTVTITEQDENGDPQSKTYKGDSIDAIKKAHPEIADKLGGFSVKWRVSPPDVFWPGQPDRRFKPLRPTTPTPRTAGPLFGLGLLETGEALASHLKLPAGKGALVAAVTPGSEADALGFRVNDVIVKINDAAVAVDDAVATLRRAAAAKAAGNPGALTIEFIRRGETRTVSR